MIKDDKLIAHEILRELRRIVRRVSEHSKLLSREVGLTVPQLVCLKAIGELEERYAEDKEEITVARVSEEIHLSAATVSRIVDRLVRAGLIDRQRAAGDRRRVCLSLTAAGIDRFQTLPVPLQEHFVRRLAELPANERKQLVEALRSITEMMDATEIDAAPMLTAGTDLKADV